MDVIPIAKPHFCTCSTFINICKDGHVLTCKPDAIFLFYFFVATNSTYVSVSVRVYIFFHLCRMKTTNTAQKNPFHRDEPYKDISREEYMRTFFYIHMGKVERVTAL